MRRPSKALLMSCEAEGMQSARKLGLCSLQSEMR